MHRFGKPFERSQYQVQDLLVKANIIQRGPHVIFGRDADDQSPENLIYIGKVLENSSGRNIFGADAWLDVRFPHVIYITGTRGSGKSFDLGVLIEGISALAEPSPVQSGVEPITSILIDTQSQFWTLRYPPNEKVKENKQQLASLKAWQIPPSSLSNIKLLRPAGTDGIVGDETEFAIRPAEVTHEDWCALMGQEQYSAQGHILGETIENLSGNYSIQDMFSYIEDDSNWGNVPDQSRFSLVYKLRNYARSGLFKPEGLEIDDLLVAGACNVFLLRELSNPDKALVTAIIARQLFTRMGAFHKRRKADAFFARESEGRVYPSKVWLLIDEAHVVAPNNAPSPARKALIEYVKRGRDAGLSLVMATQQPSAVDDEILSQVNLSFSHRLSFGADIQSAMNRIPTKTLSHLRIGGADIRDFGDMLRLVAPGQCFVGDNHTSRVILTQIRPRVTSHGGYSPS
jgi:DNA helicase HerA-like ATPase